MCNEDARRKPVGPEMDRWITETFQERMSFGLRASKPIFHAKSGFQRIRVLQTEFGETLALDDAFMTATAVEHYYHEMLVHPAMTVTPSIKNILVIGGGDGGTVREALRYPEVEHVLLVEIDAAVVAASQRHLKSMQVPWGDPRLTAIYMDGADFMSDLARDGEFDVILVDGADPVGPAAVLFTEDFYRECRRALAPFGTLAAQTLSPIVMRDEFLQAVRTLRTVFRRAVPRFAPMPIYPGGTWSWTVAYDRQPWSHQEPFMEQRMALVEKSCKYFNREILRSATALPNDLARALRT